MWVCKVGGSNGSKKNRLALLYLGRIGGNNIDCMYFWKGYLKTKLILDSFIFHFFKETETFLMWCQERNK